MAGPEEQFLMPPGMSRPGDLYAENDPNQQQGQGDTVQSGETFPNGVPMPVNVPQDETGDVTEERIVGPTGVVIKKGIKTRDGTTHGHEYNEATGVTKTKLIKKNVPLKDQVQQTAHKLAEGGDTQSIMDMISQLGGGVGDALSSAATSIGESSQGGVMRGLGQADFSPLQRLMAWGTGDLQSPVGGKTPAESMLTLEKINKLRAGDPMKDRIQQLRYESLLETLKKQKHRAGQGYPLYQGSDEKVLDMLKKRGMITAKIKRDEKQAARGLKYRNLYYGLDHDGKKEIPAARVAKIVELPADTEALLKTVDELEALVVKHKGDLSSLTGSGDKGRYIFLQSELMQNIARNNEYGALQKAEFDFLYGMVGSKPDTWKAWADKYFVGVKTRYGQFDKMREMAYDNLNRKLKTYEFEILDDFDKKFGKWDYRKNAWDAAAAGTLTTPKSWMNLDDKVKLYEIIESRGGK